MCCLFGFVDYAGSLSVKQKKPSHPRTLYRGRSTRHRCHWYRLQHIARTANLQTSAGGASAASAYSGGGPRGHGAYADDHAGQREKEL